MRVLRRFLLLLIMLIPLLTLIHRDDLGRWDRQRSAMAGPDEFSYLLMADHFLHGGGLSLKESIGRDTFYPPGYPLMLAGWAKLLGYQSMTAFAAHAFNAVLLCVDTLLAYLLARRVLTLMAAAPDSVERRFRIGSEAAAWLALLIAGIFATNWHVLECALLIMSEPAFMLVTFAWLTLAVRWPLWPQNWRKTLVMALLAIAAWSIRGAGIVCVAITLLYPFAGLCHQLVTRSRPSKIQFRQIFAIALILVLAFAFQISIAAFSREKSMAAGAASDNSYPRQLLHGLSDGNRLSLARPGDYPALAVNFGGLLLWHFNDYASSFVPWPRENPDYHFRDIIGKIFGFFGLLGWAWHAWQRRTAAPLRFLEGFVLLYMGLYLVWPFHFARFWSPLLPIMLVYAADALIRFARWPAKIPAALVPTLMLGLLLVLSAEEVGVQLPNYARRLNYVSDALAKGVDTIIDRAAGPATTRVLVMGGDEHFALAWYFSQAEGGRGRAYVVRSPQSHVAAKGGAPERVEELIVRTLREFDKQPGKGTHNVFFFSYFTHNDARAILASIKKSDPVELSQWHVQQVYQKEIIAAVWEFSFPDVTSASPTSGR